MNQDSKKAPVLRFKGFSDDWEQRTFLQLIRRVTKQVQDNNLLNVTFDDIKAGEGKLLTPFKKLSSGKQGTHFYPTNILFGKLRPYLDNRLLANFEGSAVGDFWVFEVKENSDSNFLFSLIQTSRFKYISNLSSGSKMPRSDWNLVSNSKFKVPGMNEQNKIGLLINALDYENTLQQRKLEQIDSLKNTVVATLFENKKTWSKVNLKDISEISSGANVDSRHSKGSFKITRIETISSGVLNEEKLGYTNEKIDNKYLLKKGDILFSNINSLKHIGKTALATSCEDIYQGMNLLRIRPNIQKVDPTYLFTFLNLPETLAWSQRFANPAVNQASINKTQVSKMPIYLPSLAEQIEIKNIVTKIDSYIYNLNKNIQNLKQTKNFLLQNMFI